MKRTMTVVSLAVASAAWLSAQQPAPPQPGPPQPRPPRGSSGPPEHANVTPINNLPNPYETIRNWGTLPDNRKWGSVSAVHVDVDGKHIWAGDRCGAQRLRRIECRSDGEARSERQGRGELRRGTDPLAARHGRRQAGQHLGCGLALGDAAGDREISGWKAKGHTVMKFSPQGKLLLTLGTPGEAGDPPAKFTEPNDVLVAPDGSIFVAEAHNAQFLDQNPPNGIGRISKFAPDGKFIKTFGSYGYGPSQFRGPHSLAMDSRGRLFVADRGNRRIQIFDQDGKHLETWYQFSRISGLYIDQNDTLYAIDSESDDNYNPGWRKGLRVGSARTGEVWYFVPEHVSKNASGMGGYGSMGEGVAVDAAGNVYGGEVGPDPGPDQVRAAPQALTLARPTIRQRHCRPLMLRIKWELQEALKFPQTFIDEVRAAADIVTVISDSVSLRKAGAKYKGLCPFHGEKTPSFTVDKDKGFFHCFGCGVGGDVFKFVELQDKVDFGEALRTLASRFGIPIPEVEGGGEQRETAAEREALVKIHEVALAYFREQLASPAGARWREYLLKDRGLTQETIDRAADRLGAAGARRAAPAAAESRLQTRCSS